MEIPKIAEMTTISLLPSLFGGVGLGLLSVARVQTQNKLMNSATPMFWTTCGTVLSAGMLSVALSYLRATSYDDLDLPLPTVLLAAVSLAVGAKLGKGCTFGNGIQGLGCGSLASLVHVVTFMATGIVTATTLKLGSNIPDNKGPPMSDNEVRSDEERKTAGAKAGAKRQQHIADHRSPTTFCSSQLLSNSLPLALAVAGGVLGQYLSFLPRQARDLLAGLTFSASLLLAGMGSPNNITAFLDIYTPGGWDPTVCIVMGGALAVTFPAYSLLRIAKGNKVISEWASRPVTKEVVGGGCLFGLAWGLCGLCPGPAYVAAGFGNPLYATIMLGTRIIMDAISGNAGNSKKAS